MPFINLKGLLMTSANHLAGWYDKHTEPTFRNRMHFRSHPRAKFSFVIKALRSVLTASALIREIQLDHTVSGFEREWKMTLKSKTKITQKIYNEVLD